MNNTQLDELLRDYVLEHDIRNTTIAYYERVVRVFHTWLAGQPPETLFAARTVSKFLLDLQTAEKAAYYRRSLRSGLVALLRFAGDEDRVRPVRLPLLEPEVWTPEEVVELVNCSTGTPPRSDPTYWSTLIPAAYFSGLSQCDLAAAASSLIRLIISRETK